jgi:uncharacterized membrane protein YesL
MIELLFILLLLGFLAWIINAYAPVEPAFKRVIIFVLLLVALAYVLQAFGVIPTFSHYRHRW